jgi:hypothetical protein
MVQVVPILLLILFLYLFYCEICFADEKVLIKGKEDNSSEDFINFNETGDIEFTATIHIDEMVFKKVGNTIIHFPGTQERKLIDKTIRTNLPAEIKPGVIYRNVEINIQILTSFVRINSLLNNYSLKKAEN